MKHSTVNPRKKKTSNGNLLKTVIKQSQSKSAPPKEITRNDAQMLINSICLTLVNEATTIQRMNICPSNRRRLHGFISRQIEKLRQLQGSIAIDTSKENIEKAVNEAKTLPSFEQLVKISNDLPSEAGEAVEGYLKEVNQKPFENTSYALYQLLFDKEGGYEARYFEDFIQDLIKFFIIPDNIQKFRDLSPEDTFDILTRLESFFQKMGQERQEAEIKYYAVTSFPSRFVWSELEEMKDWYRRKAKAEKAFNEPLSK
jgi:hypothetical protein